MNMKENQTLTTAKTLLSDDSDFFVGDAPIAFEYCCYEIVADTPQFNYHGQKVMIPKQESPVTI
jgi:hypothetical protein